MSSILKKLNAIRAFEAAARHESLSAGAEEINVSHPSVSRHVKELEKQLGVALFKRSYHGVKLTLAGREFLRRVSPALNEIAEAAELARSSEYSHLTVNCEPAFGLKWLVPNIHKFETTHGSIDVMIVSSRELADVGNFEADLAIRHCMTPPDDPAVLVSDSPMYPYGAPGLLDDTSPENIARQPLIFEERTKFWTDWFEHAGVHGFKPTRRMRKLPIEMAIEASCAGSGIVLSSRELVHEDVRRGRLERITDIGCPNGAYYLIKREDSLKRKATRLFTDWLVSETEIFRGRNA